MGIPQDEITIRWMETRDVPSVLEIENACFHDPWSESFIYEAVRSADRHGVVAEWDGRVVGHLFYSVHKTHPHIDNIAVDPRYQRLGIGRCLIGWMVARLKSFGIRRKLTLTVTERNLDAQLFFRATGFHAIKVIRNYFQDPDQDGYVMTYVRKRKSPVVADSASA
jgi:ribosomal-protein-alanine N-acetyltransferase